MSTAGPLPRRSLPFGGTARSAKGAHIRAAGPPQAGIAPPGGSAAAAGASVGARKHRPQLERTREHR